MSAAFSIGVETLVPKVKDSLGIDVEGRKVLVVGLARTGLAVADFLLDQGALVTATDSLPMEKLGDQVKQLGARGADLKLGGNSPDIFLASDLIILSPGVASDITPVIKAQKKGIPIMGELELAARFVTAPIIAVTGTNGKTTTTSLIGEMLQSAGYQAFVGGNIGNPLINLVREGNEADFAVVEVSSFQLEKVDYLKPHIAVFLNLSPDHIDRHKNMENYFQIKARLFEDLEAADFAILNADDTYTGRIKTKGRVVKFSRSMKFGDGMFLDSGQIKIAHAGKVRNSWPLADVSLKGAHNQENIMAAMLTAYALDLDLDEAFETVSSFQGLPHRIELIGCANGVSFVNDSKATNVGALAKSLESYEQPIVLIAGGRDKDGDFESIRETAEKKVKLLILLGEAKEKIAAALKDAVKTKLVNSMDDAVSMAFAESSSGDVVLLAPACASFDMYRDYTERGRHFTALVKERISSER